ncbi:MAG: hypothetical protein E7586_05460 [Ruminococcaceae bacterium]|nr:hypothetical protein [Oscillospiraceae bacterium]
MNLKRSILAFLIISLILTTCLTFIIPSFARDVSGGFRVNSINGTRLTEYLCVYRDIANTGQNEWGDNLVIDSNGIIIEKIPSGDTRGINLAIPQGGMVVSGNGDIGKRISDAADIGDRCIFDEENMIVYFVNNETDGFSVDSINDTRWADLICIYRDKATTEQNEWGYNVVVNSDGIVTEKIPAGDLRGKDLAIPEGGMVVSGTNDIGKQMYDAAQIGYKCIFEEHNMRVSFIMSEPSIFFVDAVNGTRWADYLCIYKDIEHTGQNEWGYNVIVDGNGTVTEKIPVGDSRGKNLAIPDGCMVVSGTGDVGKNMYDSCEVGDKCLFDEYSMRVYFGKGEINPFYTKSINVTGYNEPRYSNTVIIYNKSGTNTETNVYGYEVCVDANGYIISAGGNNNLVPQGGYVISAIEAEDMTTLKMYFTVGAKCTLYNNSVSAKYEKEQLVTTVETELNLLKSNLSTAKAQYKLIDYDEIEAKINAIKYENIETIAQRNSIIAQIRDIDPMLVESRSVETRCVWYTATETTPEEIKTAVAEMKAAGFNELVLSTDSSNGTIIPIDTTAIPFTRNPISYEFDVMQTYIDECKANDISFVVLVPVMSNTYAVGHDEWLDVTNTGVERDEKFLSPANSEYRKVFMDFLSYVITKYDVDGLQLDFIRYPQSYGGIDAGYDEATIKLFEEKTGNGASVVKEIGQQLSNHPKWNVWQSFKTELINSWVEEAYGVAGELRPDIYVTAAVAASDGVRNYCQDPDTWRKNGYIDGIYVMSYTEGINEITVSDHIADRGDKSYLVMGCGAYLSLSNQSLVEQTDNSAVYGADGTGYFEWGAIKDHGYPEFLKNTLFKNNAMPFASDTKEVVDSLVATAKARITLYCNSTDATNVNKLKSIMAALPDKNADKDAITTAVNSLSQILGETEEIYLTADLNSAIRALNMQRVSNDTQPDYMLGDVNGNGEIDSIDYSMLKRAYFGIYNADVNVGDINGNGEIDSIDYSMLKRAYFGIYEIK